MNKKALFAIATGTLISLNAHAWQHSQPSTIQSVSAYSTGIDGEILVSLGPNNTSECAQGYYVNKTRPGYESVTSLLGLDQKTTTA